MHKHLGLGYTVMETEMTKAALFEQTSAPLRIAEIGVKPPGPGEVAVDIKATGICHSDVAVITGQLPAPLPLVLGHEGSGVVTEVGEGVTKLASGDHVVLSWLVSCETCWYCQANAQHLCGRARTMLAAHTMPDGSMPMTLDGQDLRQFLGLGTFAQHTVVLEDAAIRISQDVPLPVAALMGCGVLTGYGAAVNTGGVRAGDAVTVIGCGGVGLNAV